MNIVLAPKSNEPIYEQIYNQIAAQILNGSLAANFCLPSIRVIASELDISVITIKKAWELLEQKGFIYTVTGKGCFVKELTLTHLDDKKFTLARERLRENIPYYKGLELSKEELMRLIDEEYSD